MAQEKIVGRGARDDGYELLQQTVLLAERHRIAQRGVERVEAHDHVGPIISRGQWHFDFGDDSVGAISVHGLVEVFPGQFERARARLHRQDAQPQHVAEIAQAPPRDRTYPARAAGDEAGDGSGPARRGKHPKFLPARRRRLVDVDEDGAGLADDPARMDRPDPVHIRQIQQDAAGQRHRLPVIAGAAAPRSDGNSEFIGRRENLFDFGFGRRRDHDIGRHRVEFALQNRRIPVEVATLLLDQNRIVLGSDGADTAAQPGDVVSAIHLPKPSSASSSE